MFDTPGVYIKEIPSGTRPISGVSTSNTAFIGVFKRGKENKAIRIANYGEFERTFGGLFASSDASYAIQQYFLNGGAVAFVVRVTSGAIAATVTLVKPGEGVNPDEDAIVIEASSIGAWGDNLSVGVAIDSTGEEGLFTLLIREFENGRVVREEAFIDLSTDENSPRYGETVINRDSEMISVTQTANLLPSANSIGEGDAVAEILDDLLEAAQSDLTPLVDGSDGVLPGDAGWAGIASATLRGSEGAGTGTGIYALNAIVPEMFNILCIPNAVQLDASADAELASMVEIYQEANTFCRNNFAFLLIDIPQGLDRATVMPEWISQLGAARGPNAAAYFPRLQGPDGLNPQKLRSLPSSGAVAGLYARTDANRGIWKSPAGTETRLAGGTPQELLTDRQHGPLNAAGLNCLRAFPVHGSIIWGGAYSGWC